MQLIKTPTINSRSVIIYLLLSVLLIGATLLSGEIVTETQYAPFWPATGIILGLVTLYSIWHGIVMVPALAVWAWINFGNNALDFIVFAIVGSVMPILAGGLLNLLFSVQSVDRTVSKISTRTMIITVTAFIITLPSALLSAFLLTKYSIQSEALFLQIVLIYWLSEFAGFILFYPFIAIYHENKDWLKTRLSKLTAAVLLALVMLSASSLIVDGLYKQISVFIALPVLVFYSLTERNPLHVHIVTLLWVISSLFIAKEISPSKTQDDVVLFISGYTLLLIGVTLTIHIIWLVSNKQRSLTNYLRQQALHDPSTELLNERGINQALTKLNCDYFIAINIRLHQSKEMIESLGLAKFPSIIRDISQRASLVIPSIKAIGSISGSSVIVIADGQDFDEPDNLIKRLKQKLIDQSYLADKSLTIQDMDIAMLSFNDSDKKNLLECLTVAAYLASKNPVNRIYIDQINSSQLMAPIDDFRQFQKVKKLLEAGRLKMWGQPIVPIGSKILPNKVELLARIYSESNEVLPPSFFIPLFEQFSFQAEFDKYVIKSTFKLISKSNQKNAHYTINISAYFFAQVDFISFVKNELARCDIDANLFSFELTESDALPDMDITRSNIESLNKLGINVGIDDFGTGFATYTYLLDLPFNFVKIDGRFIRNIQSNKASQQAVKAIVAIAAECNMTTVAEYVENDSITQLLDNLGVDYAQGFGIAKPKAMD
ncbi:MAG: EAL domain-containing protein [Kangiellaceae bacterium]|jgi:EAL domain-containing protein (putative c-di-GMP-specific phosphodiesterase class I)/GGDEF domain-containing protein|nr:EAL domain-containing protein [Kangiellaceae bacterium]